MVPVASLRMAMAPVRVQDEHPATALWTPPESRPEPHAGIVLCVSGVFGGVAGLAQWGDASDVEFDAALLSCTGVNIRGGGGDETVLLDQA